MSDNGRNGNGRQTRSNNGGASPDSKGGRPTKYTDELIGQILTILATGLSKEMAAKATGIAESTFYAWAKLGNEPGAPEVLRRFSEELTRAEDLAETNLATRIYASGDWRALAWLLERRRPDRWSMKHQVEHSIGFTLAEAMKALEVDPASRI